MGYERFSGDPTTQVGTGAYMLKEFEVGKQSIHVKNPFYWDTGKPYFDEVHIIDFADGDALINALLADQIDVAGRHRRRPRSRRSQGTDGYKVLNSAGGGWLTISMAVDQEPFTDVRVRQAMRLIVDRDAMVEQVLAGYGRVANDLYSPLDAAYIGKELPQRKQDIDAAKKLLADAGKSDLTIDLFAPNDTAGLPEMIQLFAEQAKGAGITVNAQVIDGGTYWGDEYLKRTFAVDYWGTRNFLLQVAAGSLKDVSPYPGRPLAARRLDVRGRLQGRSRRDRRHQAQGHHRQDAEGAVRHRWLDHPVLPEPPRRVQLDGCRASSSGRTR